jgi:hypothetical protein
MNPISYLTIQDYTILAVIIAFYCLHYYRFKRLIAHYVDLINRCIKDNGHLYTPEMRAFIQQTVAQCGITATVVPITGWRTQKQEELVSFGILPSADKIFYLNIPFSWVSFLHETVKKMDNKTPLSAEETQKLNSFIWIMHHEMNHVKSMVARKSVYARTYPFKRALMIFSLSALLLIYAAHESILLLVLRHMFFGTMIGYAMIIPYVIVVRCREEYACDIRGIEDVAILRGGADWILHDAKAYVDGLFDGRLKWLRSLYRQFPDLMCSIFTLHPLPRARAAAIEKKIAMLEGRTE